MLGTVAAAGIFHFEKKKMFEVSEAAERENVKISF